MCVCLSVCMCACMYTYIWHLTVADSCPYQGGCPEAAWNRKQLQSGAEWGQGDPAELEATEGCSNSVPHSPVLTPRLYFTFPSLEIPLLCQCKLGWGPGPASAMLGRGEVNHLTCSSESRSHAISLFLVSSPSWETSTLGYL